MSYERVLMVEDDMGREEVVKLEVTRQSARAASWRVGLEVATRERERSHGHISIYTNDQ